MHARESSGPRDLSRRSWSPATTGLPGPSAANYAAVDGPPDQVWLPWMVRFAASGPPVAIASRKNSGCSYKWTYVYTDR